VKASHRRKPRSGLPELRQTSFLEGGGL